MTDEAILYRDDDGDYRWVRKAGNGEIVGASTESYSRKVDAAANYNRTNSGSDAPELMEEDEKA